MVSAVSAVLTGTCYIADAFHTGRWSDLGRRGWKETSGCLLWLKFECAKGGSFFLHYPVLSFASRAMVRAHAGNKRGGLSGPAEARHLKSTEEEVELHEVIDILSTFRTHDKTAPPAQAAQVPTAASNCSMWVPAVSTR